MRRIILWVRNGILQASQVVGAPKAFLFEGHQFTPMGFNFGDVDYLRNKKKQLIGFAYTVGDTKEELTLQEALIWQSQNIREKDGSLLFFLAEQESFEFDIVQAIGTIIYRDDEGHFIFSIPDWGFGEMAFNLLSNEDVPIAIKE